jgi:hypothetical protein
MEYPAGGIPRTRSLVERMIAAAMLDPSVYEEVEADRTATGQAAAVVAIVAVCSAIGSIRHGGGSILGALIGAFLGWLIWAGLTYLIGTRVFGGTADMGEMLRTLGFAQAPGVLGILGIIPFLGGMVRFAVFLWTLVAAVIAIRQALDFDTGKAVLTAVLAAVVVAVVLLSIMAFFAMLFGTVFALGSLMHG